jgi:hypothetical protein
LEVYAGYYTSRNPWLPGFRIVTQKGELWLVMPSGEDEPLAQLAADAFRVGDAAHSPERLQFGMFVDGRPHEARLSGVPYHRSFLD